MKISSEDFDFNDEVADITEEACGRTETFTVADAKRLDVVISEALDITRSAAAKLIDDGSVTVDGKVCTKKSVSAEEGTEITVTFPPERVCEAVPEDIPIEIVYEDDDIAVVNKPQGMVVHPAPGNYTGTLVNALMYKMQGRLSTINGVIRPGIVHRIDKDTSGLLLIAKNDDAHVYLAEKIKEHSFKRVYNAVVTGTFKEQNGTIDLPIGRHPVNRKKMAVTNKNARTAVTNYRTLEEFRGYSLCEFALETGRTHQIRVHASYMGHPVLGDPLYSDGKNPFGLSGQCLHAKTLGITHPKTGEYMEFESELPDYFDNTLKRLREKYQK